MSLERGKTAFISGPRDSTILKAGILLSQGDDPISEGSGMKAGRWTEQDCFEVRWALVLLSGYPVVRSQPVSQASSGYQAVCFSVA